MIKASIQDGYFSHGLIVFGTSLNRETLLAKGFYLDIPNLENASITQLNEFHDALEGFLTSIGSEHNVQIQWSVDSDYADEIENYSQQGLNANEWNKYVRYMNHGKFEHMCKSGELRKERLALFLTKKCKNLPSKRISSKEKIEAYLIQENQSFCSKARQGILRISNAKLLDMSDEEHFKYLFKFFNPTVRNPSIKSFCRKSSIFQNTFWSDAVFQKSSEGAYFEMDGMCHAILVVNKLPQSVYPGILKGLLNSVSRGLQITQNIYPLDIATVIKREEKSIKFIKGTAISGNNPSLETVIQQKTEKVQSLMSGYTVPFQSLIVIRVSAESKKELFDRLISVKSSIQNLNGAQYHMAQFENQAKNLFVQTIPGWTGSGKRDWDLYAENHTLAALMPISNSFTGKLEEAEAFYEGSNSNLVGVRTFSGNTPQHAVLVGMTGAGKSVAMCDLLSQSAHLYDFTAIIEEGLSYGLWTKVMGEEPIIITPNGNQTFNYLDTNELPLTSEHLSIASKLCLKMIGESQDESLNNYRSSIITDYLNKLYWETFEGWRIQQKSNYQVCLKDTYIIEGICLKDSKMSYFDAYMKLFALKKSNPEEYKTLLDINSRDLIYFEKDAKNLDSIMKTAFSLFKREEFPTHTQLVDVMRWSRHKSHDEKDVNYLASMLSLWSKEGNKGCLFDGHSNVNLERDIVHFELGYIPESLKEVKEAVGFLISNFIRQRIVKMPRNKRKRLIFEEVSRFMDVPGGDKILAESYAQLRKYGCWVICVTQQYAQLKHSRLKEVIFGNSKLFFLMKQNSKDDLNEIAEVIGLPDLAKHNVLNYPLPEHMEAKDRCSYMTVLAIEGDQKTCGTIKIAPDPVLLKVASSGTETFSDLEQTLKDGENPMKQLIKMESKEIAS